MERAPRSLGSTAWQQCNNLVRHTACNLVQHCFAIGCLIKLTTCPVRTVPASRIIASFCAAVSPVSCLIVM